MHADQRTISVTIFQTPFIVLRQVFCWLALTKQAKLADKRAPGICSSPHPVPGLHTHITTTRGLHAHTTTARSLHAHTTMARGLHAHTTTARSLHAHTTTARGLHAHTTTARGFLLNVYSGKHFSDWTITQSQRLCLYQEAEGGQERHAPQQGSQTKMGADTGCRLLMTTTQIRRRQGRILF